MDDEGNTVVSPDAVDTIVSELTAVSEHVVSLLAALSVPFSPSVARSHASARLESMSASIDPEEARDRDTIRLKVAEICEGCADKTEPHADSLIYAVLVCVCNMAPSVKHPCMHSFPLQQALIRLMLSATPRCAAMASDVVVSMEPSEELVRTLAR
ncbi:hypothetical protein KIPB_002589 [Kipferlia bialata]|uniref:Uncharacterized protein n=1 Tax=Kipferlia bialata TaxID=797122 RepID=A0A9K3CU32_9EUKA|nr:hypothetical protein KIPB_002589 [Kipferlia bialata]|eukprot:g2589.t1